MKKALFLSLLIFSVAAGAQEKYGNTLNMGIGGGYYGYYGAPMPAFSMNYEFDVARNFTLAPFIGVSSHRDGIYWSDATSPYKYYYYRETVIPAGLKAVYYFDELMHAGSKWDFYWELRPAMPSGPYLGTAATGATGTSVIQALFMAMRILVQKCMRQTTLVFTSTCLPAYPPSALPCTFKFWKT